MADVATKAPTGAKPETDATVLLQLLSSELDRAKTQEKLQREDIDKLDRDGKRTTIMLSLAQEQIELHKERNTKLRAEADREREEAAALRGQVEKLQRDLGSARDDAAAAVKKAERREGALAADLAARDVELEQARGAVERLRAELQETKVAFAKHVDVAEKDRREAQQTRVNLTVRVESLETELADVEALRSRETKEVTAREYELSQTLQATKRELRETRDQLERENRAAFETQTRMRLESESLKLKLAQLEGMTKASDRDNFEKIQRLTHEVQQKTEQLDEARIAAVAREKALDQQIAKLCSDLKVAQQEVNELADREAAGAKHHIDTIVQLSAARDAQRVRIASLEDDIVALREKLRAAEVGFAQERDDMKRRLQLVTQEHNTALAGKSDEVSKVRYELTTTTHRMTALEEELRATKKAAEQSERTNAATIGALKAEIEGYKKAVAMLERDRNDNIALLTLKEQNETLKQQCTQLRNQVAHATKSLADLRVEADISESYRIKVIQEHVEAQLQRVAALEKERRFARPLLQDLVDVVQRRDLADPALARDIDLFFRQFGNTAEAVTAAAAPAALLK